MSKDVARWLKLTSGAFAFLSIVVVSATAAAAASAPGRITIPATAQLAVEVSATPPQRQVLWGNVAHYTWVVRLGPGEHDVIRLHRVVQEVRPNEPAKLAQAVMFFPGLPTYFTGLYLPPLISDVPARDRAIAIYLAKNGIDVWGMDYRWAMAPEDTTDFGFMRKWGVQRDVEDAQIALTLARWIRGEWSRLESPLFLTGLSYGALMSYAVAANDTQRPVKFRNVKGIIPVDYGIKFDSPGYQAGQCAYLDNVRAMMKSGAYYWDNRFMWAIGQFAIDDPTGDSPFAPGMDNYHFALGVGGWPQNASIPWHFAGSYLDENGNPTALRFTEERLFFDLLANNEPPYSPVQVDVEIATVDCGVPNAGPTYADHIGEVTVPLFYVGAAGGVGRFGEYATTLVASQDVTILVVQQLGDDDRAEDYGHSDLMTGFDAESLVWRPILEWIRAHP